MQLVPQIITTHQRILVGKKLQMSLTNYKISELWRSFLPHKKEVQNRLNNDLISFTVYDSNYFKAFDPEKNFIKCAAMEVLSVDEVPEGLEVMVIPEGMYAVFNYKGSASDHSVFQYILGSWLPASKYILDDRPHFEVLGEKYSNTAPDSEEEIWIPIKE
nr:GyrI-like domain-containing protein [uncultured Carboxylicivirga sp.]